MDQFRVAAFGDSIMWGQGLKRADRFSWRIAKALAADVGKKPVLVVDRPRSGAEILAGAAKREGFVDSHPQLFKSRTAAKRFIDGDQSAATKLYGEIPATFPSVTWQVEVVDAEVGKSIDVALVSGGANDIGFDDVIDPQQFPGKFIEEYDGQIRQIAHDRVLDLLGLVRRKCPNAVIVLFGYYMPLSYSSSKSDIKAFFKFEFDNDVMWWLNDKIEFQSVDRLVEEARIRSVWATGRAQHWMRQAVADANSSASLRGAGVLFAPAQWDAENSAWGNRPFVWNAYRHPTTDPVQAKRQAECPRAAHLDRLRTLRNQIVHHLSAFGGAFPSAAELRKLAADLGGPWPVLRYLERLAKGDSNRQEDLVGLRGAVDAEIHRIRRALIASFLHPNGKGADRYAETAVRRVRDHLALSAQVRQDERPGGQPVATPATGGETNSELLARFGLRSDGTLLADIGHLRVDSICLTVVTERASEAALTPNISLVVRRRKAGRTAEWVRQLNFPYQLRPPGSGLAGTAWVVKLYPHFEPAATNRFTVVVEDEQPLAEITGMALRMGPDPAANDSRPHGTVWRPRRVMLEINGRVVQELTFRARAVPAGGELNLRYPPRRRQSGDGQLSGR